MKCENCIHYSICVVTSYCHERCGYYEEERPHGEWIDEDYGIGKCWATCSECGESTNGEAQDNGFGYDYSFPNFCPNCGADMREGEEE